MAARSENQTPLRVFGKGLRSYACQSSYDVSFITTSSPPHRKAIPTGAALIAGPTPRPYLCMVQAGTGNVGLLCTEYVMSGSV